MNVSKVIISFLPGLVDCKYLIKEEVVCIIKDRAYDQFHI